MAAKTFDEWISNKDFIGAGSYTVALLAWNAATNSAEENFNSTLRQPTEQIMPCPANKYGMKCQVGFGSTCGISPCNLART